MVHGIFNWTDFSSLEMNTVSKELLSSEEVSGLCYGSLVKVRERHIKENNENIDDLVNLADSFSRLGKLRDAIDIYAQAFSVGNVRQDHLAELVQALLEKGKQSLETHDGGSCDVQKCYLCHGILMQPLTLPCGHTYCKICIIKRVIEDVACPKCRCRFNAQEVSNLKTNVTITNIMDKVWATEIQAAKLRLEGNELCTEGDYLTAILRFTEAQNLDPYDHLVQNCLSQTFSHIGRHEEALEHAKKAISLASTCFQGYLQKGASLVNLGQYEEAVVAYLQCLILNSSIRSEKNDLQMLICKLLRSDEREQGEEISGSSQNLSVNNQTQPQTCLSLSALCQEALKIQISRTVDGRSWSEQRAKLERIVDSFEREIEEMNETNEGNYLRLVNTGIDKKDFECSLCMRLFWQPVTTPCGHMYCRMCLDRSLDHKPHCPLCKNPLTDYLAERRDASTEFMENLVSKFLPIECQERKKAFEEEMEELSNAGKDPEHKVPLFVCTTAFPDIPCPLHIFEPRYRLMTRQCVESGTREFGMCASLEGEVDGIATFGTMLVIRDISYYPDGRSIVDSIGSKRFKVLQTSMRDGYYVGSLEFITDCPVPDEEVQDVQRLHDEVYSEVFDWFLTVPQVTRSRVLQHFGPLPAVENSYLHLSNGPRWLWWTLAILPIDVKAQVRILGMDSLRKRLESLQRVLRVVSRFGPQGISQ